MVLRFFPVMALSLSSTAFAGEASIEVRGQQSGYRSDDRYCPDPAVACGYPGGKAAFKIRYKNEALPWGVKVELWHGFAGQDWCGGCDPAYHYFFDWRDTKFVEMRAVSAWTWSADTDTYGFGAGAGGQWDALEFVVRVTFPDGGVQWDNGGSNTGYYKVYVPQPQFDLSWTPYQVYDSPFESLPVQIIRR